MAGAARQRGGLPHGGNARAEDELTAKGRRTRAMIIEAAQRVFEREGFVDSRVSDISAEAGVAHGTFYLYFNSKDEVFHAVLASQQAMVEQLARTSPGLSPREAIAASNRSYLEGYAAHRGLMITWAQVAAIQGPVADLLQERIDFNIERTERALRRWQERGQVRSDLDPAYAARALTAMTMQFCILAFTPGAEVDLDLAERTLTDLWIGAIGLTDSQRTPPG